MTRTPPGDYDEDGEAVWTPNIHGNSGAAGYVSNEARDDGAVRRLREVVAEVTREGVYLFPVVVGQDFTDA